MQTSFLHPPFGFALFYLRSVAPSREYDRPRSPAGWSRPVTTGQIYWGALPFVVIQLLMVAVVIAFPGLVLALRSTSGPQEAIRTRSRSRCRKRRSDDANPARSEFEIERPPPRRSPAVKLSGRNCLRPFFGDSM